MPYCSQRQSTVTVTGKTDGHRLRVHCTANDALPPVLAETAQLAAVCKNCVICTGHSARPGIGPDLLHLGSQ